MTLFSAWDSSQKSAVHLTPRAQSVQRLQVGSLGLIVVDQPVGGRIVGSDLLTRAQLWQDALGELLSELNSPLVEGVDVPDDSLDKDLVLVDGDQTSKSSWIELLEQEGVRRTVSWEHLVIHQRLIDLSTLGHLALHLIGALSLHEGLSLGKVVGEED